MNKPIQTNLRFNFVGPPVVDNQDYDQFEIDKNWQLFTKKTPIVWIFQAFLMLRVRGVPSRYSQDLVPGYINIGHSNYIRKHCLPRKDVFVVSITADNMPLFWANAHIVQNQKQLNRRNMFWVPHWPQPGLIPRERNRSVIENVAYAGQPYRLTTRRSAFKSKLSSAGLFLKRDEGVNFWSSSVERLGLKFRYLDPMNWNDMSKVDILIGIRSFDEETYNNLPPSKLINAWHAGVPFIGGNDSAYKQIGTPGLDYLSVSSEKEAFEAISAIKNDPELYRRIVDNGRMKSVFYTRVKIADRWLDILQNDIAGLYVDWLGQSPFIRFFAYNQRVTKDLMMWGIRNIGVAVLRRRGQPKSKAGRGAKEQGKGGPPK